MPTTHNKLENIFGKIEKSDWKEAAEKRQAEMPWKRYSQQIALEVLEHLDENGFSQKYFADQMGVSAQVVSKWLKGGENFTLETISKMEAVLGFDLIEVKEKVEILSRFETETFEYKEVYKKPPVSNTDIKMSAIVVQMQSSYLLAKTS